MKKLKVLTGLFIVGFFILPNNWMPSVWGMASRPPLIGSPAPEFQLENLSGVTQSLEGYRGKVVLLNFWATWCEPCTKEMPAMQTTHENLQDQGFVILAINELEDIKKVREHILEYQHTFDVLLDPDNQVANMYGVVGLPVSVFIDKTGHVRKVVKGGLLTEQSILQTVQPLLQESITEIRPLPPS
ncbi:MAG: TlpA family protein disulfide reductase [Nitrospirales bacterium]|nr:TlpA family protein disulfide reductase [Nitrospirales bacterium]